MGEQRGKLIRSDKKIFQAPDHVNKLLCLTVQTLSILYPKWRPVFCSRYITQKGKHQLLDEQAEVAKATKMRPPRN